LYDAADNPGAIQAKNESNFESRVKNIKTLN